MLTRQGREQTCSLGRLPQHARLDHRQIADPHRLAGDHAVRMIFAPAGHPPRQAQPDRIMPSDPYVLDERGSSEARSRMEAVAEMDDVAIVAAAGASQ